MSGLVPLVAMLVVLLAAATWWRLPIGIALLVSAVVGTLSGGFGLPVPQLVEGTMLYLDPILLVLSSLFFMKMFEQSGGLRVLNHVLMRAVGRTPVLLVIVLTLFVMFPGMLTGLTAPCILTTGAMIVPILRGAGMPNSRIAAFIAVAAFFGMAAPPVNICAMLIGGGVDMPYVNFGLPLSLCTFPLAFASSLWIARHHLRSFTAAAEAGESSVDMSARNYRLLLPLLFLLVMLSAERALPQLIPHLGIPLLFTLSALLTLVLSSNSRVLVAINWSIREALPVLALLAGVGMFIQALTLSGARGLLVVETLVMPHWLRDAASVVFVPLFGGVSAYGSSSVLGVPLLLSMLERNAILVAAALSLLASIGDFLQPTRLAVILSAQVTEESSLWSIQKLCIVPALTAAAAAVLMILFANPLAKLMGLQ